MRLVGRRDFVKALGLGASAAALTPFARGLIAEASGDDIDVKRWVFMITNNGMGQESTERWTPRSADLTAPGALPPALASLEPWASKMLVLDHFYNHFNPGQHGPHWAALACRGELPDPLPSGGSQSVETFPNPSGVAIDVHVARTISDGAPFSTIGWSTDIELPRADHALNRVVTFHSSGEAYSQMFGGFAPGMTDEERLLRLDRRLSVLDLARPDLERMRARLAGPERAKLDQMETSIREMEERLTASRTASAAACELPAAPAGPGYGDHGGVYPRAYSEQMVDLHTTALLCGLSNVYVFSPMPNRRTYAEIIGDDRFPHDIAHENDTSQLERIDTFNCELLARTLRALEAVPEAGGTMADRTLASWFDVNGGYHHVPWPNDNIPLVLVGDLAGHFRTGRHVRYPKGEHAVGDAFVSLLHAFGIAEDTFGDPSVCRGPLPGLTT